MYYYVEVGKTVVSSWYTKKKALLFLRQLANGCGPHIKKCPQGYPTPRAQVRGIVTARQQSNPVEKLPAHTHKIVYLKPGEFRL